MTEEKKVNGWTNQETYQVKMYLDNDLYYFKEEILQDSKNWIEFSDKLKTLIKEIEDYAKNGTDKISTRIVINIGSIWRVDFDEIAKSYMNYNGTSI